MRDFNDFHNYFFTNSYQTFLEFYTRNIESKFVNLYSLQIYQGLKKKTDFDQTFRQFVHARKIIWKIHEKQKIFCPDNMSNQNQYVWTSLHLVGKYPMSDCNFRLCIYHINVAAHAYYQESIRLAITRSILGKGNSGRLLPSSSATDTSNLTVFTYRLVVFGAKQWRSDQILPVPISSYCMKGQSYICSMVYNNILCVYSPRSTSDVKHAASYVEERSTANVLADQFFE